MKVIHVEAKKEIRRRIVRELHIMHECNSDFIVNFYGAFLSDSNDVIMCMEYMDVGYIFLLELDGSWLTLRQSSGPGFPRFWTNSS